MSASPAKALLGNARRFPAPFAKRNVAKITPSVSGGVDDETRKPTASPSSDTHTASAPSSGLSKKMLRRPGMGGFPSARRLMPKKNTGAPVDENQNFAEEDIDAAVDELVEAVAEGVAEGPADDVDPYSEGFVRIDGDSKPPQVSDAVWSTIFPFDYEAVLLAAGKRYLFEGNADRAILHAVQDVQRDGWSSGRSKELLEKLAPLFPHGGLSRPGVPMASVSDAILSIDLTARRHWKSILEDEDGVRAAFRLREWHSKPGTCLLCGEATTPDIDEEFQGDNFHLSCVEKMKEIGPVYGHLVIEKAEAIAADPPEIIDLDAIPEGVDPDDPSTW